MIGIASADPWFGGGRLKDNGDTVVDDTILIEICLSVPFLQTSSHHLLTFILVAGRVCGDFPTPSPKEDAVLAPGQPIGIVHLLVPGPYGAVAPWGDATRGELQGFDWNSRLFKLRECGVALLHPGSIQEAVLKKWTTTSIQIFLLSTVCASVRKKLLLVGFTTRLRRRPPTVVGWVENFYAWLFCACATLDVCLDGYDGVYFTGVSAMDAFVEHFGQKQSDGSHAIAAACLSLMTSVINIG
ncbi:hypothetical protein BBP40_006650 [Aspergillus hancockii]|nr:hypothetical protein BBP40_006650 [Aspergillus hancockii]